AAHLLLCATTGCSPRRSAGSHARFLCSVVGTPGPPYGAQREGAIAFLSAHGCEAFSGRRTPPRDGDQAWKREAAHSIARTAYGGTERHGTSRSTHCRADLRAPLGFDVAGSRAEPIRGSISRAR